MGNFLNAFRNGTQVSDVSSTNPLPVTGTFSGTATTTMSSGDRASLDNASQVYTTAAGYTPSDSTTTTAGRAIAVVATVAGNVSVLMGGGGTFVFPVPVGLTILPLGVTRVNVTGTTATATYTKLT